MFISVIDGLEIAQRVQSFHMFNMRSSCYLTQSFAPK